MEPVTSESSTLNMCHFQCTECKKDVVARMPLIRVFNFIETSGLIFTHEKPAKCECGTLFHVMIGKVSDNGQIKMVWKAIQTKTATAAPTLIKAVNEKPQ